MYTLAFSKIKNTLFHILARYNFPEDKAHLLAKTYTQSSCDGVYSHGLNRFPLFIDYVEWGLVDVSADPERVALFGSLEQWDGNQGAGISQVFICIDPATFSDASLKGQLLNEIIDYVYDVPPMHEGDRTFYPGERTLATRKMVFRWIKVYGKRLTN